MPLSLQVTVPLEHRPGARPRHGGDEPLRRGDGRGLRHPGGRELQRGEPVRRLRALRGDGLRRL